MRFLLTRPRENCAEFAHALILRGHDALIVPLMRVELTDVSDFDPAVYAGVLVTSANGVRALAQRTADRHMPVLAVGPQTAAQARQVGFADVVSADGNAATLAAAIPGRFAMPGPLLHACGTEARQISVPGYRIDRIALYRTVSAGTLPECAAKALREKTLNGVFVFSPGGARTLARGIRQAGLDDFCTAIDAYCISEAAAKVLTPLPFAHFYIAREPNRDAMLDMLPVLKANEKIPK